MKVATSRGLLLGVAAIVVAACLVPGLAQASCWASNSSGTRICADYQKPGIALVEHLCEDHRGDCEKLGYEPVPSAAARESQERKSSSESDEKVAPATRREPAEDASADSRSDDESAAEDSQESPGQRVFDTFLRYGLGVALLLLLLGVMLRVFGYPIFGSVLKWLGGGVGVLWLILVAVLLSAMARGSESGERGRRDAS